MFSGKVFLKHTLNWITILFVFVCSTQSFAQVQFQDRTNQAGPFHTGESWGASWCDFNNDELPDMFVSNHAMSTSIYINNGDGTFTDTIVQADTDKVLFNPNDPATVIADIHGGSCADIDNDGDQDLIVTRSSSNANTYIFENNGQGVFEEKREEYGIVDPVTGGRLAMPFDYTNDGLIDFAVGRNGGAEGITLFKQDPNSGQFINTTDEEGITGTCKKNSFGIPTKLFDNEKSLYLCMNRIGIPEKVYDTSVSPFADVTSKIDPVGNYSDATMADFNNDLKTDMFVVRGKNRPNGVKRINAGRIEAWLAVTPGQEKKVTFESGGRITINMYSRTVTTRNRDSSDPDYQTYDKIFVGSAGSHPPTLPITLRSGRTSDHNVVSNRDELGVYVGYDTTALEWTLYLSGGNSADLVYFTIDSVSLTEPEITGLSGADKAFPPLFLLNSGSRLVDSNVRGIGAVSCNTVVAEDFDNDMDIDLFLGCGTTLENLENRLYYNDGTGNFDQSDIHGAEGITGMGVENNSGSTETVIAADYDIDGNMDIFATNGNRIFPHIHKDGFTGGGPDQLFQNVTNNGNNWLEIDLQGVNSNRDGFGAKVIVTAGGVSQLREQDGRYHRWSHDHRRLHFGLASNTQATVTINWPDGTTDLHEDVLAGDLYRALQGGALFALTDNNSDSNNSTNNNDDNTNAKSIAPVLLLMLEEF